MKYTSLNVRSESEKVYCGIVVSLLVSVYDFRVFTMIISNVSCMPDVIWNKKEMKNLGLMTWVRGIYRIPQASDLLIT